MKEQIKRLNRAFINGDLDNSAYVAEAYKLLRGMDWQKRIQYENMLFAVPK